MFWVVHTDNVNISPPVWNKKEGPMYTRMVQGNVVRQEHSKQKEMSSSPQTIPIKPFHFNVPP